jgi:tetratricopeptide (TPR) repeat protein
LLVANRLEEGVRHLRQALELDPNNAGAYFTLGVAAARRGDRQEAMRCWSRAVALNPQNVEAHHNLAIALDEQGHPDQAIEHYRKALQLKPDAMTQAQLGVALCDTGAIQEGVTYLSDAANSDPANNVVRYLLATTLAGLKRHDQAIGHFQRILRLDPRHTDALVGLAGSYAETRQMDKALGCLEEALRIAQSVGNRRLAEQIVKQIELYRQKPR